jgi:hypothetical protein
MSAYRTGLLLQSLSQTMNLTMIANHNIKHVSRVTDVFIRTVGPNSKHITHTEESHVVNVCGPKIKTTLAYTTILIVLHEYLCPVTFHWVIEYALEILALLLSIPTSRVRPLLSPHRWQSWLGFVFFSQSSYMKMPELCNRPLPFPSTFSLFYLSQITQAFSTA